MSGPEYDPEFEAYLRGRVRLDRRLPRSFTRLEPAAELDRRVIGMAREAIQPLPEAPLFRAPKWAVPLAMAASLLVSFTLMLDVGLRQGQEAAVSQPLIVEMTNPSAPLAPSAPAPAPQMARAGADSSAASALAAQDLAAGSAAARARAGSAAPEGPRVGLSRTGRQRLAANRAAPSHGGAIASGPAVASTAAADAEIARASAQGGRLSAQGGRLSAQGGRLSTQGAGLSASAAGLSAPAARLTATAGTELEETRYSGGHAPAPIRLASAPPEMDTVVVIGTRIQLPQSNAISAIAVQSLASSPDPDALAPPPVPDVPSSLQGSLEGRSAARNLTGSASPEAAAERREHPDPKVWLDHIEKMQAAGQIAAADQEMKLFRDAYPAYAVP